MHPADWYQALIRTPQYLRWANSPEGQVCRLAKFWFGLECLCVSEKYIDASIKVKTIGKMPAQWKASAGMFLSYISLMGEQDAFFYHLRNQARASLREWRNEQNKHDARKYQSGLERLLPSTLTESGGYIDINIRVSQSEPNDSIIEGLRRALNQARKHRAISTKNAKRHTVNPWVVWDIMQIPGANHVRIAQLFFGVTGNPSYDDEANKRRGQVRRAFKMAESTIAKVGQRHGNLTEKEIEYIARLDNMLMVTNSWLTVPHEVTYKYFLPRNHFHREIHRVANNHKAIFNRAPNKLVPFNPA